MSSHHSRSPTSTGKIDRLSEVTLSGGQQTYESFGSRTTSVKTLSVSTSKPPSPTLIGEGSASVSGYQAVTGNSASNSVHSSSANIASDLVRLATSGSVASASARASSLRSSKSASSLAVSSQSRRSSNASSKRSSPKAFLSTVEEALLRSDEPIEINETAEVEVFGNRGVWVNKEETLAWRGSVPLEDYPVNEDDEPEVITKRSAHQIEYVQELAIRYLRPPTPPAPGEIVITQEPDVVTGPAPPLIIRQQPPRPETPEPLVIREAPPEPPMPVGVKKITISGKQLPPPPRKVIIERLAPLPAKPQNVIIERWLPYSQVKRRVIFNKPTATDPVIIKPRNIIVQWEAPQVQIKKEYKYLGVITANPVDYVAQYGPTLKQAADLPEFVLDIKAPEGLTLAADVQASNFPELEGDVHALKLVDLEKEGLGEYSDLVRNIPSRVSRSSSYSTIRPSVGTIASSVVSQAPRPSSKATSVASSNVNRHQSSAVVSTSSSVAAQSRTTSIASKAPSAGSVSVVSKSPSTATTPRPSVRQSVAAPSSASARQSSASVAASSSASVRQSSASVAAPSSASVRQSTASVAAPSSASVRQSSASVAAPSVSNPVSFSVSSTTPGSARQSQVSGSARQSTASTAVVSNAPSVRQSSASVAVSSGSASVAPVASRTTSISKSVASVANSVPVGSRTTSVAQSSASVAQSTTSSKRKNSISSLIEQIFHTINRNNSGGISIEDAEKALLRLNSRLGRRYGEDDVIAFFSALDKNQDGTLDFDEFKSAFENIVI